MLIDGYPVHFTYDGDFSEVLNWLPLGKKLLSSCIEGNIPSKKIIPAEGVSIWCTWMGGIAKLHIIASSFNLIHGLCSLHLTRGSDRLYATNKSIGVESVVERRATGYSALIPEKKLLPNFSSTIPSYSYVNDVINNNPITAGSYTQTLNNSTFLKNPGKYTGEMRKVVQILIGMGKGIPFEYSFRRSHGIIKSPTGVPWVIEIGNRGIYAAKLGVSQLLTSPESKTAFKTKWNCPTYSLEYVPSADNVLPEDSKKFSDKLAAGKIIQLRSPNGMTDFYNNNPYFSSCGWAFSNSGYAAQNTCWNINSSTNISEQWIVGKRYKVNFTFIGDVPAIVSFSLEEEGFLYGDRLNHVKVPVEENNAIISLDWFGGNFNAPSTNNDTTWYVFYDDEAPVYCKYKSRVNLAPVDHGISDLLTVPNGTLGIPDVLVLGVRNSPQTYKSGIETRYIDNHSYVTLDAQPQSAYVTGRYRAESWSENSGEPWVQRGDTGNAVLSTGTGNGSADVYVGVTHNNEERTITIVPFFDRELVYFYTNSMRWHEAGTVKYHGDCRFTIREAGGAYYEGVASYTAYLATVIIATNQLAIAYWDSTLAGLIPFANPNFGFGPAASYPPEFIPGPPGSIGHSVDIPYTGLGETRVGSITTIDETISENKDTLIIYGSGIGRQTVFQDRDILTSGIFPHYRDIVTVNDGIIYESIVDSFSNGRLISRDANDIGNDYIILNVNSNYSSAYQQINPFKFFFGVP